MNSIINTTITHRTNNGLTFDKNDNPCSFLRCDHSTTNIMVIKMTLLNAIFFLMKTINKLTSNIPQTYSQAIPILSALKIIHPITAKKNVKSICPVSFIVGNNRPSATWFVYLRFFPVSIKGKKRIA